MTSFKKERKLFAKAFVLLLLFLSVSIGLNIYQWQLLEQQKPKFYGVAHIDGKIYNIQNGLALPDAAIFFFLGRQEEKPWQPYSPLNTISDVNGFYEITFGYQDTEHSLVIIARKFGYNPVMWHENATLDLFMITKIEAKFDFRMEPFIAP